MFLFQDTGGVRASGGGLVGHFASSGE